MTETAELRQSKITDCSMLSINQPYFFPNIGYFSLLCNSQIHVFLDSVKMRKKSWITRNSFGLKHQLVAIPIQQLSQNRNINEHLVCNRIAARDSFIKTFTGLNGTQPFLKEAIELVHYSFETKSEGLTIAELNQKSTVKLCELMDLNVKFKKQSDFPDLTGKKETLLINICKNLDFQCYLNLQGGELLYTKGSFLKQGIKLHFVDNRQMKKAIGQEFNISILSLFAKYGINMLVDTLCEHSSYN